MCNGQGPYMFTSAFPMPDKLWIRWTQTSLESNQMSEDQTNLFTPFCDCLFKVSIATTKHHDQKTSGEERLYWAYTSKS